MPERWSPAINSMMINKPLVYQYRGWHQFNLDISISVFSGNPKKCSWSNNQLPKSWWVVYHPVMVTFYQHCIPSGYVKIAMERSTIFHGKIHYKWAIFNSYVKLPEGIWNKLVVDVYLGWTKLVQLDPAQLRACLMWIASLAKLRVRARPRTGESILCKWNVDPKNGGTPKSSILIRCSSVPL